MENKNIMLRSFGTTLAGKPNDRGTIFLRQKYSKRSSDANKPIAISVAIAIRDRMCWGELKIVAVALVLASCSASPSRRGAMLGTKQIRLEGRRVRIYVLCAGDDCPMPTTKTPVIRQADANTATLAKSAAAGSQASSQAREPESSEHQQLDGPYDRSVGDAARPIWTAYFAVGSARIDPRDKARLQTHIASIGGHKVLVCGYTDALGARRVNERLAWSRARAVGALLEAQGVAKQDIVLRAYPSCCGLKRGLPMDEVVSPAHRKVELTIEANRKDTSS